LSVSIPENAIIQSDKVLDLTSYMDADGMLDWEAPAGDWTILRMGHTTTGQPNRAAPDNGKGLEVDKYRAEAFDKHFDGMFERLLPYLKPLADQGQVGISIDSYEVGMQNWTKEFPAAFEKNMKYSLLPYLAALTGRVVDSPETTERFL